MTERQAKHIIQKISRDIQGVVSISYDPHQEQISVYTRRAKLVVNLEDVEPFELYKMCNGVCDTSSFIMPPKDLS